MRMPRGLLAAAMISAASAAAAEDPAVAKWQATFAAEVRPVIESRCLGCHSGGKIEGDLDLAAPAAAENLLDVAMVWERVAARVRLNEMPPAGAPGLSDPQKAARPRWPAAAPGRAPRDQLASARTTRW